jgi:hypothetical protein
VPDHLFEVISKLDKKIRVSVFYWNYISTVKHTSISGLEADVRSSLTEPIEIRKSKRDPAVYLYYGTSKAQPFVCTVVKHLNGEGFVITAYPTRRMVGDLVWKKN